MGFLVLFALLTPAISEARSFALENQEPAPWVAVLDEILQRAESEQSQPTIIPDAPPAPIHVSTPGAVRTQPEQPAVQGFIRYFSSEGARGFAAALQRLALYRRMIERTFEEEGVPRELLWLGLVESGFNPRARSPKNAVGMWQFVPAAAERYGLALTGGDERTDPVKSTRAAAQYLKFLYARFGDWPLAMAAYNAGEQKVQTAINRGGTTDFWRLAELGLVPRETQAYVPAVLAARHLGASGLGRVTDTDARINDTAPRVVFATVQVSP